MANEISTTVRTTVLHPATATVAPLKGAFDLGVFLLTQTTAAKIEDVVTVGFAADQVISIPTNSKFTAALQGIFCAINRDATNYVDLGPDNGGTMLPMVRLYPRYPVQFPVKPSVVLRWQANTAACEVEFVWFAK